MRGLVRVGAAVPSLALGNVKENMKYIPKDLKAITQTSDAHGYRADNKQNILMGNIQLSYNKDLNEKHHIDALALVE